MNHQQFLAFANACSQFRALLPRKPRLPSCIFPFYHAVSDTEIAFLKNIYEPRPKKEFVKDLDFFCAHFQCIGPEELLHPTNKTHHKSVFITFDDGLANLDERILDLLLERGIPVTVFVNTAFLNDQSIFDRYSEGFANAGISYEEYKKQVYLTEEQCLRWIDKGVYLGSHGNSHPLFSSLSFDDQKREIELSFNHPLLKQQSIRMFSFPFTDAGVSFAFFEWLHHPEGGKVQLSFGTAGMKDDTFPNHYQRFAMEREGLSADEIVRAEAIYRQIRRFLRKNRVIHT